MKYILVQNIHCLETPDAMVLSEARRDPSGPSGPGLLV